MNLSNIQGIIPPLITPFKQNGDVDFTGYEKNLIKWNSDSLSGYLVLGSNSETIYLSEQEKLDLIKTVVTNNPRNRIIIAGTGLESARETIRFTNKAARLGVDAALILTPFYYHNKMTNAALIAFFTEIADHTDIPVMIYNVPKFTHINVSHNVVQHLAVHPNIIGMKDSFGSIPQLVKFNSNTPQSFQVMVGTASIWYPALSMGIKTGILAVANFAGNMCADIQQAFERGDHQTARDLYLRLLPVDTEIASKMGIAGLKYAADLLGYIGGSTRNPLQPLTEIENSKVADILKNIDLLK